MPAPNEGEMGRSGQPGLQIPQATKAPAEWVDIASLLPWVKNPRRNDNSVGPIAESIKRFGFGAPIVARRENGEIIAGHTRVKAALRLGMKSVPVRYLDLNEHEAHALAVADNKLGELAEWDDATLSGVLRDLAGADVSIQGLGFDAAGLADLPGDDEDTEPLPLPSEADAQSRTGEVYELGPHRLVCGDSANPESWAQLLPDGERLQVVWTDPPYGVDVVGGWRQDPTGAHNGNRQKIANDDLPPRELALFLAGVLRPTLEHCTPGAAWYVSSPSGTMFGVFAEVLAELGVWRHTLVWVKDSLVLGRADHHYRHETIFYGWAPGAGHFWCGRRDIDSVFEIPRPKRSKDHPTMKPVALVRAQIEHSSEAGWVVGDPLAGSGTTLISSACTGRIARLIELSPGYCDVIRRRWTRWAAANGEAPGPGHLDG